ncbi:MAG: helicase-related protein [Pseudomonadota bacterium]
MGELKAVLGPTNTGKTHYAIERMLGHASGMIGLPLRLLAREVYDRVVEARGVQAAALITGEERIWPHTARYLVCTVESMPMDQSVDFLAIDEVQLAADQDRGHVFTDRLLRARGRSETLLLGAETIRPLLKELGLGAETDVRKRFSDLGYAGAAKITKLPKRTAIVAFSAQEVYAIAELLRRQKGGAAVVMGALSPRTRNAQVALYQSGEVDYLVATDAIGMGLNLDIDHVAFAGRAKFDGRRRRRLSDAEIGQIAGRAGRFTADGAFGETGDCPLLDEETVDRVVRHDFEALAFLEWRNSDLAFDDMATLLSGLSAPSPHPVLSPNRDALDEWVLRRFSEDEDVGPDYAGEARLRRLWDVCRLPDFRKAGHEGHFNLVRSLLEQLIDPQARLNDDWMRTRIAELQSGGPADIGALQSRLAAIRTWTYASHRSDWLENPATWQDETRDLEDKLSDALHDALTARFVDRRTTALLAGLQREDALVSDITPAGEVSVEGHVVGRLSGLVFKPESTAKTLEGKAVRNAAFAALRPILSRRLADIETALPTAFSLEASGDIAFDGEPVARPVKGAHWLAPRVELIGGDEAAQDLRERARTRIEDWLQEEVARVLPSLSGLRSLQPDALEGMARGLAFRLMETGAAVDLREDEDARRLTKDQRDALKAVGVRAGRVAAHAPDAQKPAPQRLIALLRGVFDEAKCPQAPEGAGSFSIGPEWSSIALSANGYLKFGGRALRADLAERLAWELQKRRTEAGVNSFAAPAELASVVSCPGAEFPEVLKGFGLTPAERDAETNLPTLWRYTGRAKAEGRRPAKPRRGPRADADANTSARRGSGTPPTSKPKTEKPPTRPPENSPFAALAALVESPKGAKREQRNRRKPSASKPGKDANTSSE